MLEDVHSFLSRQLSLKVPSSSGANGSFPTKVSSSNEPTTSNAPMPLPQPTSTLSASNNALQYRSFRQHHRTTHRQTSEGPARPSSASQAENISVPKIGPVNVMEDLVDDIASGVAGMCRTIREKSAERLGEAARRTASVRSNPAAAISQTQQQTKLAISKVVNRVASFRSAILSHSSSRCIGRLKYFRPSGSPVSPRRPSWSEIVPEGPTNSPGGNLCAFTPD